MFYSIIDFVWDKWMKSKTKVMCWWKYNNLISAKNLMKRKLSNFNKINKKLNLIKTFNNSKKINSCKKFNLRKFNILTSCHMLITLVGKPIRQDSVQLSHWKVIKEELRKWRKLIGWSAWKYFKSIKKLSIFWLKPKTPSI